LRAFKSRDAAAARPLLGLRAGADAARGHGVLLHEAQLHARQNGAHGPQRRPGLWVEVAHHDVANSINGNIRLAMLSLSNTTH